MRPTTRTLSATLAAALTAGTLVVAGAASASAAPADLDVVPRADCPLSAEERAERHEDREERRGDREDREERRAERAERAEQCAQAPGDRSGSPRGDGLRGQRGPGDASGRGLGPCSQVAQA